MNLHQAFKDLWLRLFPEEITGCPADLQELAEAQERLRDRRRMVTEAVDAFAKDVDDTLERIANEMRGGKKKTPCKRTTKS